MFQEMANTAAQPAHPGDLVAYVPSMDRYALQVAVPLGIAIPKGMTLQTDSYTSPALHYRRCDRDGCYVEMPWTSP